MTYVKCSWYDSHLDKYVVRYYGPFLNDLIAFNYVKATVEREHGCDGQHEVRSYVPAPYRPIGIQL